VVICATAPVVKSVPEAKRQIAPAQTSDTVRIFKDSLADGDSSTDPFVTVISPASRIQAKRFALRRPDVLHFLDIGIVAPERMSFAGVALR
jgi:hypothetical protein